MKQVEQKVAMKQRFNMKHLGLCCLGMDRRNSKAKEKEQGNRSSQQRDSCNKYPKCSSKPERVAAQRSCDSRISGPARTRTHEEGKESGYHRPLCCVSRKKMSNQALSAGITKAVRRVRVVRDEWREAGSKQRGWTLIWTTGGQFCGRRRAGV